MTTYRKPNFQAEGLIDEPARVRTPRPSRPDLAFDYADLAAFLAASQDHPMTTDTRFEAATDFAPGGTDYACCEDGLVLVRLSQHPNEQDEYELCACPLGEARAAAHAGPAVEYNWCAACGFELIHWDRMHDGSPDLCLHCYEDAREEVAF